MAAKSKQVFTTSYNSKGGLVVHTAAPAVASVPANTLAGIAGSVAATIGAALTQPAAPTGARTIGMVSFVNGWPNGIPVPGMAPYTINGAPYTGPMAHTNPIAKQFVAGKPQATSVPAFANQNVLVKHSTGKTCPLTSTSATNAVIGPLVHAALAANGGKATLGTIANYVAQHAPAELANITSYVNTHAFKRMRWLVKA